MKYGIWVKAESFDVYEDGSKRRANTNEGWRADKEYESMKAAKESLATAKEMLEEDCYDVVAVNTVTLKGVRYSTYNGEPNTPTLHEENITYHIEKR